MQAYSRLLSRPCGRGRACQQTRCLSSVFQPLVRSSQKPAIASWPKGKAKVHCNRSQRFHSSNVERIQVPLLRIADRDGKAHELDSFWLRDHCQCTQCVNQDTMQRKFDTFTLPTDDPGTILEDSDVLRVQWRDGHISEYSWQWLGQVNADLRTTSWAPSIETKLPVRTYFGSEISANPPSVKYQDVMGAKSGLAELTEKILKFGFCYVDDSPVATESTEQLLNRIGPIRETHYGGFYDFTADLSLKDTAYTSQALPAHTDNTYFTEPSRLQMFHLLSHTGGEGGASLLVDGYKCLQTLSEQYPEAYKTLRNTPLRWHASGNDGITITPWSEMAAIEEQKVAVGSGTDSITQLRWNNDDRATLRPSSDMSVTKWYEAARLLDSIIKDPKNEYWAQLKPGRPLIFDNWRVLHGRSAFTGQRRICGAYIMGDDFMSTYLNTNFPREAVLKRYL